ncbi:phosphonate metabolism transcriptional regulator PhnF [Andreprevotia chitinilytica]|uniref:phosphonate metabolism transcriptional regulator PhnF n=1 Tax=Andreprevotia chitinilytica TaxID=396808 RepID=UPI001FE09A3D|nr:phosphonate metabolism transcriptional regulator PhnF [Andreprevotia chitinilytica]
MEQDTQLTLWRKVELRLYDEIAVGKHAAGERLPAETELAEQYGVNRHTLRKAMKSLADKGVIVIKRGHGMFVAEQAITYPVSRLTQFGKNMQSRNVACQIDILSSALIAADAEIAGYLDLPAGQPVYELDVLSTVDGCTLDLSTIYFPAERFIGFPDVYRQTKSVTRSLAHFGVADFSRRLTRVAARIPDADLARRMNLPRNQAVLHVQSVNVDAAGVPVQYGIARFVGNRLELLFESEIPAVVE